MNKIRAIVVDDEPKSRQVLMELLELFCKNVEVVGEAGNIANAIRVISEKEPDLVFFDILLQEGDSFEIIKGLEKVNFEMIFVTAFDEDSVKALKFSGAKVLLKPIQINELIDAVKEVSHSGQSLLSFQMADGVLKSSFTKLPIVTPKGLEFKNSEELLYVQDKAEGSELYFQDGFSMLSERTIDELMAVLDQDIFYLNGNMIINRDQVLGKIHDGGSLKFKNGIVLNR